MITNNYRIKNIISKVVDNRGRNTDYFDFEKYPIIDNYMIKNEIHPELETATRFLSEDQYHTFLRGYIDSDDLLMTLVGNGIGNVTLSPHSKCAIVQNTIGLAFDKSICDQVYIYYYFKTIQPTIRNLDRGSSQPSVNREDIFRLRVQLPNITIQNKIVSILSAYDHLIEVNNKRIKVLEQMAENLYKEWFVRFRFPGHETAKFENGIPRGWKYTRFEEICSYDRGVSYSTEEIECDEGENLINLKNIQGFGGFRRDGTKKYNGQYKTEQIVHYKDLIMGVTDMTQDRRTVGAVALIPSMHGVISADLIKLNSKIESVFLYCLFRWGFYSTYISQFGNGANVIHLKPSAIKNTKILIPKSDLIKAFVKFVDPLIDQIDTFYANIDNLITQRDLLLPRLMSGKLEV